MILFELFALFRSFIGDDNDVEAAKEFIKNKYLNVMPSSGDLKRIYPHFTCSIGRIFVQYVLTYLRIISDKENIQMVFNAIEDRLFADILYRISYS